MWETWVRSLGWEDPLEKGRAYPLQYSGLENSTDCIVHGVAKGLTRLSDFHFSFIDEGASGAVCGRSLVAAHRLLIAVLLLPWSTGSRHVGFSSCGSQRGLSCSVARGIFPDQGWNPCLLHWQADS